MSDAQRNVTCGAHGKTRATFVCTHLQWGIGCGFHPSTEDPADPWPDAWCDACEAAYQREGEWNDSNEPKIVLQCTCCYEVARARNAAVPSPIRPGQTSLSEAESAAFTRAACARNSARQTETKRRWAFDSKPLWRYDDGTRTIRFYDDTNGEAVVADVRIAGSFSTRTSSWMWSWGNEQYAHEARAATEPVRVFGEIRGIERLASAHWKAEEIDGWEVTNIAADLLGAEAIYRAPFDHLMVFMLLSNFRREQRS